MKPLLSTMIATVLATVFFSLEAVAAIQCYQCHGTSGPADYRPLDATHRNYSTGGFKGNHRTHMGFGATPASCNSCHGNGTDVGTYLSNHKNGRIDMVANINNSPKTEGATYSKGVFFNQTSAPTAGTCSNVNCHFESATPSWGNPAFTSPNGCNQCHGAPPNGGSTGAAGSHLKHDSYYPGADNCGKCHSDHAAETNKFAHATSAGRDLVISLGNPAGGAYTGPVNDYLPSQTNVFGNCTNLYCHSNGQKAFGNFSTNSVPAWGTPLPASCIGCHAGDGTSGTIMKSGSHDKHVNPANLNTIACAKCHADTTGVSMTIIDTASHVNAKVNIKFNSLTTAINGTYAGHSTPYAKDPGAAYGQCNNVYCHSSVQSGTDGTGAPTYRTPTWGNTGTGGCGSCHAGDGGHTAGNVMSTGSHTAHLSQSFGGVSNEMKCVICHNIGGQTMSLGQGCDVSFCHSAASSKHADGKIDVSINPYYGSGTYNGSMLPRAGFNTCSNISCHFNTTSPIWGTTTRINCFGCHTLAALMASGSHAKHISSTAMPAMYNYTANRSTAAEYDFGCSSCHPLDIANHMNGSINVTLKKDESGVGTLRSKNGATTIGLNAVNSGTTGTTKVSVKCTSVYCHSNGNTAELVYAPTPDWYGGTFTGDRCANCHGNSPNSTIPGSKAHYNNRFLGYSGVTGGHAVGIHAMSVYSSANHIGTDRASSHGNAATATTISCNICHYATVKSVRNDQNEVCKTCHYAGNSLGALTGNGAVIADKAKHVNGAVDVEFKNMAIVSKAQMRSNGQPLSPYSSIWKRDAGYKVPGAHDTAKTPLNTATMWNGTTKTCSNIACHNGEPVKWSDTDGTTNCVSCHATL